MKTMMKILSPGLLLTLMLCGRAVHAGDSELSELREAATLPGGWIPVKNDQKHSIQAWQKREDNKTIRSFKLDYIVDVDLETVGLAYLDIGKWPRWWWKIKDIRLLKRTSAHNFIFYMAHNAPVANPDRDVIIQVQVEPYTRQRGFATMTMRAIPDFLPPQHGLVRMEAEDMVVKFTPLDRGRTRLELEGFINPAGNVPSWTVNFLQRQAPYSTALAFQRYVEQNQDYYQRLAKDKKTTDGFATLMAVNEH